VDKELPLKFKPFKKVGPAHYSTGGKRGPQTDLQSLTVASLKKQKNEIMRVNCKKAREEFIKNKFSRPSQLVAPIDSVDYFRETAGVPSEIP
jgi:predicted CoA-binding protein